MIFLILTREKADLVGDFTIAHPCPYRAKFMNAALSAPQSTFNHTVAIIFHPLDRKSRQLMVLESTEYTNQADGHSRCAIPVLRGFLRRTMPKERYPLKDKKYKRRTHGSTIRGWIC